MKKLVLLSFLAVSSFTLFSCQKCQTCSYTYTDNGQLITADVGDACGETAQLDQLESDCQSAAQVVGGNCTCSLQ
jgi:hypothetical protein